MRRILQPILKTGDSSFLFNLVAYHWIMQGDSEFAVMVHCFRKYVRVGVNGNFTLPLIPEFKWTLEKGFC